MKIINLKPYDLRLYTELEKYHIKRKKKKEKQGFTGVDRTPINLVSFRWAQWVDPNLYRVLFSLRLLEDLELVELISENKVVFLEGADKSVIE